MDWDVRAKVTCVQPVTWWPVRCSNHWVTWTAEMIERRLRHVSNLWPSWPVRCSNHRATQTEMVQQRLHMCSRTWFSMSGFGMPILRRIGAVLAVKIEGMWLFSAVSCVLKCLPYFTDCNSGFPPPSESPTDLKVHMTWKFTPVFYNCIWKNT